MRIVTRANQGSTAGYIDLASVSVNAGMDYDVDQQDFVIIQLDYAGTVVTFGSAVLTVQVSLDGVNYYAVPTTAVTYSAVGVQPLLRITGAYRLRLQVTTADAAAGRIIPVVRVGVET